MYMSAAAAGQTALLPAGRGDEPFPRGVLPFRGVRMVGGGRAVAGLSQRLAVTSLGSSGGTWGGGGEAVWSCPGGLACLSRCHLWNQDSQPAASSAQEGGQALWEEKALRVNKAKTSWVIAEPTLAHVCEERWGVRN